MVLNRNRYEIKERGRFFFGREQNLADSVLEVTMAANEKMFNHLKEDPDMCDALRKLMKPEMDQAIDQAVRQTREETRASYIQKLAQSYVDSGEITNMNEAIKKAETVLV